MSINPRRTLLEPRGLDAAERSGPFRVETDRALAQFRTRKEELQRGVKRGELTPKVARRIAREAASELREGLIARSETFSASPRSFKDRLNEASNARDRARESASLESLQRETNRLLKTSLIEQEIRNREDEFRGRTYLRPVQGGEPTPTIESLLRYHDQAAIGGDEAAREWSRRQLESRRDLALEPADQRRIDLACDRPDRINPRLVDRYVEQMSVADETDRERFALQAIDARDANACIASYLLARETPEGVGHSWVRRVLNSLDQIPDAALAMLRSWEVQVGAEEAEAARVEAERVLALVEAEAAMPGLTAPGESELDRLTRHDHLPPVAPGESIGLTLQRRGLSEAEFRALQQEEPSETTAEDPSTTA